MAVERMMKTRLVSLAVLLIVLGAGFLVGVVWERRTVTSTDESAQVAQDSGSRRERGERRLIVEQVGLSPEQKAKVDSIVAYHRERMEALQDEVAPRYRAIIDSTRESIKGVLTEEQRVQYDSLLAARDNRRREHRDRGNEQREPRE